MRKAFSGLSTFKTLLCVVAALTALPFSHAQNTGPVRIGVLAPITGPLATPGAEMIDALKMFWDKNNNTVSGRKDRKSTRLNSSHSQQSRMPSSA